MFKTPAIAAVLTLTAALSARPARADELPYPVERALQTVGAESRGIMAWVYPTVTYRSVTGCRWRELVRGYDLSCVFNYTDTDGDSGYRRIGFRLDENGLVDSVGDRGGSDVWPAFASLRLAKELVAQMARDEIARGEHNDRTDQALLDFLARSPEPEEVLAFILDVRMVSQR